MERRIEGKDGCLIVSFDVKSKKISTLKFESQEGVVFAFQLTDEFLTQLKMSFAVSKLEDWLVATDGLYIATITCTVEGLEVSLLVTHSIDIPAVVITFNHQQVKKIKMLLHYPSSF